MNIKLPLKGSISKYLFKGNYKNNNNKGRREFLN